jgi:hypothetical protein
VFRLVRSFELDALHGSLENGVGFSFDDFQSPVLDVGLEPAVEEKCFSFFFVGTVKGNEAEGGENLEAEGVESFTGSTRSKSPNGFGGSLDVLAHVSFWGGKGNGNYRME